MKWDKLLNDKRRRESGVTRSKNTDVRSAFENDFQRIVMSASFRRLQDKTQVFPLEKSDFVRTRLTHSMEVSTIAKSMGNMVTHTIKEEKLDEDFTKDHAEKIPEILACAGLLHDMGNPPFGHFGEESIREWFRDNLATITYKNKSLAEILTPQMKEDFYYFEGNAQVLRVVSKLHYLFDQYGLNLTFATLNAVIKYPVSSLKVNKNQIKSKKLGYFYADESLFNEITTATEALDNRHPLTYLLEVADDIAYLNADLEDGVKKGIVNIKQILKGFEEVEEHNKVTAACYSELKKKSERYEGQEESFIVQQWLASNVRGQLINRSLEVFYANYEAIMAGTFNDSLIDASEAEQLVQILQNLSFTYIYQDKGIVESEIAGNEIISKLLETFIPAVIYYDSETPERQTAKDKRLLTLISDNYLGCYRKNAEGESETMKLYLRLLLVTDFICGMTDSYAKDLYQRLNGLS
ncbi:deoxyguanosinetriphosphate triphosphohydrolase [Listeria seeligeri]|uniref:deoxyguanosinetriphosphate triphosphohydrolase n=1 Tax=Listeria seeligeri TaxID=1640 RepID=UPI0018876E1C|nr:deoxyguanosinetriphosphate triphosphohydrolase [Listeria seeligeri]MBF2545155.1 deoxyguanosinetriphosphate triphosphohydrolase [Listeria seeligeri]